MPQFLQVTSRVPLNPLGEQLIQDPLHQSSPRGRIGVRSPPALLRGFVVRALARSRERYTPTMTATIPTVTRTGPSVWTTMLTMHGRRTSTIIVAKSH